MLSHPKTARNGNADCNYWNVNSSYHYCFKWYFFGYKNDCYCNDYWFNNWIFAVRVEMTQMPQLVAIFNGFGGGASGLVASAEFIKILKIS